MSTCADNQCMASSYFLFLRILSPSVVMFFFFNDTATTEIYTLSLHDALPISGGAYVNFMMEEGDDRIRATYGKNYDRDRKSTRLNSSHLVISYAVFCLKKKKIIAQIT